MKTEKIEELWNKNSSEGHSDIECLMDIDEFTDAINQAELEWHKKLEKKLGKILVNLYSPTVMYDTTAYYREIQNKIKELENGE